jgi:hypothetical protein
VFEPRSVPSACRCTAASSPFWRLGSVQNLSHFRLAERRPTLAHAAMASLICWSFSKSMSAHPVTIQHSNRVNLGTCSRCRPCAGTA